MTTILSWIPVGDNPNDWQPMLSDGGNTWRGRLVRFVACSVCGEYHPRSERTPWCCWECGA